MTDAPEAAAEIVCPYCQGAYADEQALRDHFCPMAFQH
jgi:hypothetical protein